MDNPLTPNRIQRLMHLAEDKSFNSAVRGQSMKDETQSMNNAKNKTTLNKTGTNYEPSSGILDLEQIEGFCESGLGIMSLSKSNIFNPGELTGRSTGTEDENIKATREFEEYGRHSVAIDSITSHMDKQTSEINDIMRHSIATNYSFHSKRDLTADEASLVMREAPLPVQHSTQLNIHESMLMGNTNLSVGAYFKNRCPEFGKILGNIDSPNRPSITDVSSDMTQNVHNNTYKMDQTLDCVPVRQPRAKVERMPDRAVVTSLFPKKESSFMPSKTQLDLSCVKQDKMGNNTNAKKVNQPSQKTFKSSKPTDVLLRNLQSSMRLVTDETECSTENSLSISKIADYLGKQSNVSVTDILQLNKRQNAKRPLTELQVNKFDSKLDNRTNTQDVYVTHLKDTKNMDTASSSGTVNTVISLDKLKIGEDKLPAVIVTRHSLDAHSEDVKSNRIERSNSPSSKSWSTLSTVQENGASFKSDSPVRSSKGQSSTNIPSPTLVYRELDESVDWRDVLEHKYKQESLAKAKWAEIIAKPVEGFVGVVIPITISVTTLTDSWLTAKFEFDDHLNIEKFLNVELPRLPLLLSPGKTEKFTIQITSNVEIETQLAFTMYLKDASIDGDIEQKGHVDIDIKMPVIQAISCDGVNKVSFPTTLENTILTRCFVLISDCPVDLQLELLITEGDSLFAIRSLQEIKKTDVSRALMERQASKEDAAKSKGKGSNKQLCRLSSGDAIRVAITFNSPILKDLEISEKMVTFKGALCVNMIGIKSLLKKISLIATVGSANLVIPCEKLNLTNEATTIRLLNDGEVAGVWAVKFRGTASEGTFPFKVSSTKIEINAKSTKDLSLMYTGSMDTFNSGALVFEDTSNGNLIKIDITGGQEKVKTFPIKTNFNNMSWVRNERKEISLKNSTDRKVQIRCQIIGEGFQIDLPGVENRGSCILSFGACECRPLPIIFVPKSAVPYMATLHLVYDKNSDFTRKIKLHGSTSGACVRWSALLTYGDTALAQAAARAPTTLALYNKGHSPAFVCATLQFNLQYRFLSSESELLGAMSVVKGRSKHSLSLRLPWARLERRARAGSALANVTVLAGPELTRRRILRIMKSESTDGKPDLSLLPDHLHLLTHTFEGEDPSMDSYMENFSESKASLNELIESLQELSAKIDLPQEFPDDNTIVLTDDTVVEHYTLCD